MHAKYLGDLGFESWAKIITVSYLSLILGIVCARVRELISLPLNELGDFAAGAFGPLAFLWLVLGYRQQGKELSASTQALEMQVSELKASFDLQQEIAKKHDLTLDPVLQVKSLGCRSSGADKIEVFSIESIENACRQFTVEMNSGDGSQKAGPSIYGLLSPGKAISFNGIKYSDGQQRGAGITVKYIRANGSKGSQRFIFVRFSVDKFVLSPELEYFE
ncbi:hypothetical protein [Pseudomonas sp. CAM1A]|uniref:hypothetical protein n=1 Tax=Pseudomonas sp. CAM1A TaxID=3231717 RepID=UPI0039C6F555